MAASVFKRCPLIMWRCCDRPIGGRPSYCSILEIRNVLTLFRANLLWVKTVEHFDGAAATEEIPDQHR
jgi:hypothetical protein